MLNSRLVRWRSFFRFAFFSPILVGQVFVAVIFSLLLAQRQGLVNIVIGKLIPAIGSEINWLGDVRLAMPAVIVAALWLSIGYGMIYFLAALQSVDRELYEAAEVDGSARSLVAILERYAPRHSAGAGFSHPDRHDRFTPAF